MHKNYIISKGIFINTLLYYNYIGSELDKPFTKLKPLNNIHNYNK
jgi:hypothetical protein